MKPVVPNADVYTDFNGLAKLRLSARKESPEAIKAAAEQFEALFLQMMLKSMRDASMGDELFDNDQTDLYRDMFDQQIALTMSKRRSLGMADMVERQLTGNYSNRDNMLAMLNRNTIPVAPSVSAPVKNHNDIYKSGQDFIEGIWPYAEKAAKELGIKPEVLVAQSALETGWGQRGIKYSNGYQSHNLFGIKADGRWQGRTVSVNTTEYVDGVLKQQPAKFRAYVSPEESFNDYVDFIKNSPRYQQALNHGADSRSYIRSLQEAGYATDPNYANKVMNILNGDIFGNVMKDLNISAENPINILKGGAG